MEIIFLGNIGRICEKKGKQKMQLEQELLYEIKKFIF